MSIKCAHSNFLDSYTVNCKKYLGKLICFPYLIIQVSKSIPVQLFMYCQRRCFANMQIKFELENFNISFLGTSYKLVGLRLIPPYVEALYLKELTPRTDY